MNEQQFIAATDKPIAIYTEFESQLIKLEQENKTVIFDYSSKLGEKAARSHIHKLRLTKGVIDRARKSEKENALTYGRRVDGEAQTLIGRVEVMIGVHQKPLDEAKEKEVKRVNGIKENLRKIEYYGVGLPPSISALESRLLELHAIEVDESFDEYMSIATTAKNVAIKALEEAIVVAITAKKDADELEKLRFEKVAQERRDREDRIKKEAAEEAERKANEVAAELAERIAAEHKTEIERKDAAAKAEREATEATERADRKRADEEVRAALKRMDDEMTVLTKREQEAEERADRAEREAAEAKTKFEQDQRDKEEKERLEAEERAADEKHRMTIDCIIMDALMAVCCSEQDAESIVAAINDGSIPYVSITY